MAFGSQWSNENEPAIWSAPLSFVHHGTAFMGRTFFGTPDARFGVNMVTWPPSGGQPDPGPPGPPGGGGAGGGGGGRGSPASRFSFVDTRRETVQLTRDDDDVITFVLAMSETE